jgi:hypothetical protein
LKEFKDVFAWAYKDLKRIPLELAQHGIELDITIPLTHHTKYVLNPNYATTFKLLAVGFIQFIEEATWFVTQNSSTQEEWQIEILYRLLEN